jgi:glutathione peroxidase
MDGSRRILVVSDSLFDIALTTIEGRPTTLRHYQGEVLLIVNVASKCGLTPQYEALQRLFEDKRAEGLRVLGFPANDFMGQEPGSDAEIAAFCTTQYAVQFPLFAKISVQGPRQHALYKALIAAQPIAQGGEAMRQSLIGYGLTPSAPPGVLWNFEKFLIGRSGRVVGRFSPDIAPGDPRLIAAVDRELAEPVDRARL